MGAFLKKDIIVLLRDRTELLVLLVMPFILTVILGFALSGLLGGNAAVLEMEVAIVDEDDREAGAAQIEAAIAGREIPEQAKRELLAAVQAMMPSVLLDGLLESGEVAALVTTVEMEAEDAQQALRDEQIAAVLTIPQHFTEEFLRKALLDEGSGSELQVTISDFASTQADVFYTILDEFAWTLNYETALAQAAAESGLAPGAPMERVGGTESITAAKPLSALQYYSIGMAAMFSLFVASTIASKAYVESYQHVFDRILLSNRHPFLYLSGKAVSAAIITFGQLFLLFGLGALLFGTIDFLDIRMWIGIALVSAMLSICIGAIATVLTSLTLRYNNETITTIFAGGLVSVFAFLGGSFIPVDGMPEIIPLLGGWTPNGAALTAYLSWMQHLEFGLLVEPLVRIGIIAVLAAAAGFLLFPRKRGSLS